MKAPADDAADRELIAGAGRGDQRAYSTLVGRHLRWALRFVERMVGDRADAEDIVQIAFLRVWQGAAAWRPEARFSTWFYRVLYNLCMDHYRSRAEPAAALDEGIADHAPSNEDRIELIERAARVRRALASLPERQRAALVLCHYEELSQAEAAAMLGVSEGALESLLSRGRAAMKKLVRSDLH